MTPRQGLKMGAHFLAMGVIFTMGATLKDTHTVVVKREIVVEPVPYPVQRSCPEDGSPGEGVRVYETSPPSPASLPRRNRRR